MADNLLIFFPPGHKIYTVRNLASKNTGLSTLFGNNPTAHLSLFSFLGVSLFSENAVSKFRLHAPMSGCRVSKYPKHEPKSYLSSDP